jgi:hypothetical protein
MCEGCAPALASSLPAQWRQALELTDDVTVEASDTVLYSLIMIPPSSIRHQVIWDMRYSICGGCAPRPRVVAPRPGAGANDQASDEESHPLSSAAINGYDTSG